MSEISKKLSKTLSDKKVKAEDNIKEHPLPYVMGTFVGGIIVGYLIARKSRT